MGCGSALRFIDDFLFAFGRLPGWRVKQDVQHEARMFSFLGRNGQIASEFVVDACPHLINGIRRFAAGDVSRWGLAVKIWTRPGAMAFQRSEYS